MKPTLPNKAEKGRKGQKKANKPKISESQLQASFFQWFRLQYPHRYWQCFAIPNGGLRNKVVAAKLKREGCVSGVWDVLLLNNSSFDTTKGLFIEFKVGYNKLTENQEKFRKENYYYDFAVCYTLEEAVKVVNDYLSY